MFPFHGGGFHGGGQQIVMGPYGPMVIGGGGGGGGGAVVMTAHGPMLIGGGGGFGGGGGGGGQIVMTPYGPMMVGGGGGGRQIMVCKYCMQDMPGPFDEDTATSEEAKEHSSSCPRRVAFERKEGERERERERERDRVRERAAAAAAAAARRPTWRAHSRELSAKSAMLLSSRGKAPAMPVDREAGLVSAIAASLMERCPYPRLTITGAITEVATGQAIVLRGMFQGTTHVAVKISRSRELTDFNKEVELLCHVGRHKNVMSLLDSFSSPRPAIILPLAEKSLCDMLGERALPKIIAVQYALQIAKGLQHIHTKRVAHLDLKSDNILVDCHNVCMITDFGLSEMSTGSDDIVQGRGTMQFIAPEGLRYIGHQSDAKKMDIYAFGMVMFELVSGLLPHEDLWEGDAEAWNEAIEKVVLAGKTPKCDPRWDGNFVRLMQSCWGSDPHHRPDISAVVSTLGGM
jgi:hypothetical protein